ncbi:MAG TPA: transposase [Acidimicrobiales bacterium]|nr:transposase [Acidimicrobiales bacterium]
MAAEGTSEAPEGQRRPTLLQKVERYGTKTVEPVRNVRASLATEGVPYQVQGREFRINPKLLSYWIPFLVGVGVMVGGMKTAGVPLIGIPQLLLGVVLIAVTTWDFVSDSGRLDVEPSSRPARLRRDEEAVGARAEWAASSGRRSYAEEFRHNAVEMVLSDGMPVAVVARELDISPSTLGKWVNRERQARADRGELAEVGSDDTLALPPVRRSG